MPTTPAGMGLAGHSSLPNIMKGKEIGMGQLFWGLLWIGMFVASAAGWCQHLYTCFNEHYWGFLIAGAICFPVAIVHGWGIWFGWWS